MSRLLACPWARDLLMGLALLCALLVIVKHAENIVRLIGGTESKLQIGGRRPARDEDFEDPD